MVWYGFFIGCAATNQGLAEGVQGGPPAHQRRAEGAQGGICGEKTRRKIVRKKARHHQVSEQVRKGTIARATRVANQVYILY